ncbi:DUF805 domain-containing protein [Naumannella sp. ID2617S]|nr:DUF805 domain-containing protein [Naumannella sp. ID2617S]
MQAMKLLFKNALVFNGRANKGEYWWAFLGMLIVNFILGLIFGGIMGAAGGSSSDPTGTLAIMPVLYIVMFVVNFPLLSAAVRRLHDTGRSGWMYLVSLIPFVGSIILIVLLAGESNPAGAQYDDTSKKMPALPE